MKSLLFIILLISNAGNNCFTKCEKKSKNDLTEFIDRMCNIYGIQKPKPEIDYLERVDVGIRRRIKYGEFICVEFINKKYADNYFKDWVNRGQNDPDFRTFYKGGINIVLIKNYVIEEHKLYQKNCEEISQTGLEDKLYSPYLKKNKKTFIRVKCDFNEVEIK